MRAFYTTRKCACGHALWAVMGEPERGLDVLVTLCVACDLQGATVETAEVIQPPANDSAASAEKE